MAVANPSTVEATRRLEIYADGALVDARELTIPPGQRSEALVSTVPPSAASIEARLAGSDALATDDRAFAIVPAQGRTRALLVGAGNAYLENALALLPRLELYAVGADGYEDAARRGGGRRDAVRALRLRRHRARRAPPGAALYIDPPSDGEFGTVEGRIEGPLIDRTDPDEPILRFVDLTTVHIGRARELPSPTAVRIGRRDRSAVVRWSPSASVGGRRVGLIGFDLGESDLPLQVAFPLLMSNLVERAAAGGGGHPAIVDAARHVGDRSRRSTHRARRAS